MKIGIILSSNDPEEVWNTFRFANDALKENHAVRVFLETLKSKDFQKDLQEKMVGLNALPDTGQIKDVNP